MRIAAVIGLALATACAGEAAERDRSILAGAAAGIWAFFKSLPAS